MTEETEPAPLSDEAAMEFHKPKPVHDWREFLSEIGVIVIGVLIALSAEQVVETLHWRAETAEAQTAMKEDLQGSADEAYRRVHSKACYDRWLDTVDRMIVAGGPKGPIRMMSGPISTWSQAAWQSAVASGAISHLSSDSRTAYSSVFSLLGTIQTMNIREFELWQDLQTLDRGAGDATSRDRLRSDIARLRGLNGIIALGSQQFLDQAADIGVKPGTDVVTDMANARCRGPEDGQPSP